MSGLIDSTDGLSFGTGLQCIDDIGGPGLDIDVGLPVTLIIGFGQSNAKGWSADPTNTTTLTAGYGYDFYPSGSNGVLLPMGFNIMGRTQGGPQRAFCQAWTAAAGGTVIWVDASVNGCSMTKAAKSVLTGSGVSLSGGTFDLTDAANLYAAWSKPLIQNAIAVVRASGFAIKKTIVVWAQGETDAGANALTNGPAYEAALTSLFDQVVIDFDIDAFVISLLGAPSTGTNSFWDAIRTAQGNFVATRSSLALIGFSDAQDFPSEGKMSDTLHYTQAGYNEMGAALAPAAYSFVGSPIYSPNSAVKHAELAAAFPSISGFKRIRLTTARNGTFPMLFTGDPTTPYATTWVDGSGSQPQSAEQTLSWSFTSSATKQVAAYISDTIGSSGSMVGGSNCQVSNVEFVDAGIKLSSMNFGTAGSMTSTATITSLSTIDAATARTVSVLNPTGVQVTTADLQVLTGLTTLVLSGSATRLIDVTNTPNLTRLDLVNCSLSTSDVNTILIALDGNGKNSGLTQLSQTPSAPPSGAGATAKTSLQGRGWTVSTN